jgi:hypothetical protein
MTNCSFTTTRGRPCQNAAKYEGLCAVHFGIRKAQGANRWEKVKQVGTTIGAIAGGTAAVLKLVEEAVKVWSSLPFGPMPSEAHYESLLEKIGPFWPEMPKAYTPRNKSHPDWATAEQLYDSAQSVIEGAQDHAGPELEEAFNDWFLNLPDWYQQMIAERFEKSIDVQE